MFSTSKDGSFIDAARADDLTPQEIVERLDQYIVGQEAAKRAVAVALRNRYRRRLLPPEERQDITPKNILMIGPTGVGKTEIARRVAEMIDAPFVKVEATKYTEVGYVGRDVESMIADLVEDTVARLHDRRLQEVQAKAEERAMERIVDYLVRQQMSARFRRGKGRAQGPRAAVAAGATGAVREQREELERPLSPSERAQLRRERQRLSRMVRGHQLDDAMVEIEVLADDAYDWDVADDEEPGDSFRGFSEYGASPRRRMRVVSVKEAKRILTREEANKLVDFDAVVDEALERVEESGIVFIDELDKIVGSGPEWGSDISGEGVQRDLLPIVEGSVVMTRYGPVNTQHILFIAAGSFSRHKPSDLIPELQGRFPLRVELRPLSRDDLRAILVQPRNSLLRQYQALLRTEGVELVFTEDGVDAMADIAWHLNQRMENIGARRLQTVVEQVVEEISFNAPNFRGQRVVVDAEYVRRRMRDFLEDEDLSRYIL